MSELTKMLDEVLADESDRLSDWEIEFIESLNKQRGKDWSQRQADVLQRIWDKVFG